MASPTFLTHDAIDIEALIRSVTGPERGGTAVFLGSVRRSDDDGPVEAIEYSAYEEMVEAEFGKILNEAAAKWPDTRVEAQHRLGVIPVGEASIAIAAASPHRAAAFDACRFVIEEVKVRLPVWKKERFADGSEEWREEDRQ